jgi:hypothetical protein
MARGKGCTAATSATPRGSSAAVDATELQQIIDGSHRRVYLGLSTIERARARGWSDAEILQVARELADALDDYDELLDNPDFRRVLRWSRDEYLAASAAEGWHRDPRNPNLPKKVGVSLLGDENIERDGWGVTSAPSAHARVDTRRPGIRLAESDTPHNMTYAADPRYTALHEAHHMHGSGSEFDLGSDVAFAWHCAKRGLEGPGPDSIRSVIVSQLLRGSGPTSRPNRAIRKLLGDQTLDAWAVEAGYRDIFNLRPVAPEDHSLAGRVAWVNALEGDCAAKMVALTARNMVEASDLYLGDLHAGERAFMRPNGEALALAADGSARALPA